MDHVKKSIATRASQNKAYFPQEWEVMLLPPHSTVLEGGAEADNTALTPSLGKSAMET